MSGGGWPTRSRLAGPAGNVAMPLAIRFRLAA